jgi:signal transduction histidine kinase
MPLMGIRSFFSTLSISTRLTLWFGLSLLILLSLFVAGLYTSVHVGLHQDLESRLREEAAAVQAHLQAHGGEQPNRSPSFSEHDLQATTGTHVRLLGQDGDVIQSSASFRARPPLPAEVPPSPESTLKTRRWAGASAQSLYVPLQADTPVAWMEVTKLQSPIHRQLHNLRWLLVLGIGGGVAVAMLVGYGLARRALRPVASLTAAAKEMQAQPTGTLPTDFGVQDELSDLAETLNGLLQRLRDALQRERRFRADAAHNMFTPLTAIQSELDVTLRNSRSEGEYREALHAVQRHTETLSSLLDELMTLSRIEARDEQPALSPLDMKSHAQFRVNRVRQRADAQDIEVEWDGAANVEVPISAEDLDLILDHLLDNALKYTPDGGTISVCVDRDGGAGVLRVSDSGIGFDAENAECLFDRFYRTSAAEQQANGGGLGLPIVNAIAESYGGTVSAHSPGREAGSTFEVRIPLPQNAHSSTPTLGEG